MRFVAMPALSVLFVSLTAAKGWYIDDPLVWCASPPPPYVRCSRCFVRRFLLVLIPAGPSAMLLMSVAELVDVDQGPIAGYLTVSYLVSPLMAFVCSVGLTIVDMKL